VLRNLVSVKLGAVVVLQKLGDCSAGAHIHDCVTYTAC
jgi:hypothetical protein